MKARIKDKIWTRLSELSPRDVDAASRARIRERSLASMRPSTPSRSLAWARRVERIWTDFIELPMAGVVIVACLMWAVQGAASRGLADGTLASRRGGEMLAMLTTARSAAGFWR